MNETDFDTAFEVLAGSLPFPWQRALYRRFISDKPDNIPPSCNLPTGLGKTSVIQVWLLALVTAPRRLPPRLVYVVNRRTVVDQATREAEKVRERVNDLPMVAKALRELCAEGGQVPLAISTLRGQFADNGEWRADPARPAIVVGTVDMIGSRLLFSGYGCGFKSRPLHAGFLGQDVLLVHDEAHLEPPFQSLLTAIQDEQRRSGEFRQFRVMELTATSRGNTEQFNLTPADIAHPTVQARIRAKKQIELRAIGDEKKTADEVVKLALAHEGAGKAILVYLRRVEDVEKVASKLPRGRVERLTGTLRGHERDRLATAENPVFAHFLPPSEREGKVTDQTVYLVCTSAGEVGVNISADHLVCDLAPFDSMAQRFGRVNRFGDGEARIDIVHPTTFSAEEEYEIRRRKTLGLLLRLGGDGSPAALNNLPPEDRQLAFTPEPNTPLTSDILFDAWALTTIRYELPGRPPVANWLHGTERDQPDTCVAWRDEVGRLTREQLERLKPDALLDDYPLKPHELLRDRADRVLRHLEAMAERTPNLLAWVVEPNGKVSRVLPLPELVAKNSQKKPLVNLEGRTVLLPPGAGGVENGTLNGAAPFVADGQPKYDVADEWFEDKARTRPRRLRRLDGERPNGMRQVRAIELGMPDDEADTEADAAPQVWRWYVRIRSTDDDAGSSGQEAPCRWQEHLDSAGKAADNVARRLNLPEPVHKAVVLAAIWHDLGKRRAVWQRGIGNTRYDPMRPETALAKSNNTRAPEDLNHYRHEFGSLLDLLDTELAYRKEFDQLSGEQQDLVLHLIAAHHGRGRPHFDGEEAFDPERSTEDAVRLAVEVPRRFARLQRKYGRWGLAYLESLVRAADIEASQPPKGGQP